MNSKLMKYYETMLNFGKADYVTEPKLLHKFIAYLLDYDYQIAFDMWEYVLIKESDLVSDPKYARSFGDEVLNLFMAKGEPKAVKAINDSLPVRQVIYQYSAAACENPKSQTYKFLLNMLLTNKLTDADEILKCFVKNTAIAEPYPKTFKKIVDDIIVEILKKAANKSKVEMPRKLAALLKEYITKMKGPEKALLEQKIKEVT